MTTQSLALFEQADVVPMMTAGEAQQAVSEYKTHRSAMYVIALSLYEREGWRALNYQSWYECAKKELEIGSEDSADNLINAGRVQRNILYGEVSENSRILRDTKFSTSALLLLKKLPVEQQQPAAVRAIETAPNGKVTAAHIGQVVREWLPDDQNVFTDTEADEYVRIIGERTETPLAVHFTSNTPEWYTPTHIIERVIRVFGQIDLDPCSNSHETPNVPAFQHYTWEDDGINQPWHGRVYMNPPYGDEIGQWTERLWRAYEDSEIAEAIALLPSRTDTAWFQPFYNYALCFVRGRLKFSNAENSAPFPSVVVYLGRDVEGFKEHFGGIGRCGLLQ